MPVWVIQAYAKTLKKEHIKLGDAELQHIRDFVDHVIKHDKEFFNRRWFLLIPQLKIHNANAMSSPYTIGFPAITAWMGAVHALQRYLHQQGLSQVNFKKVAVSCHKFELPTYKR